MIQARLRAGLAAPGVLLGRGQGCQGLKTRELQILTGSSSASLIPGSPKGLLLPLFSCFIPKVGVPMWALDIKVINYLDLLILQLLMSSRWL